MLSKLFFLLSGEHETLPVSEVKAILRAERFASSNSVVLDQVLKLEVDQDCVEAIRRRAALTRLCCLEIFTCSFDKKEITRCASSVDFSLFLRESETFQVRIRRVRNYEAKQDVVTLERELGKQILTHSTKTKVDLKNPDKTFAGVITGQQLVFGLVLAEIPAKPFVERRPREKVFFHPSAMSAKLSRCMVNLTEAREGELLLDPFCGTGGMLTEAALIGCRIVGLDVQPRMIRGTRRNMTQFRTEAEGLIVGDVRKLPLSRVDRVATDPPYGRSTVTMKRSTNQLLTEMFEALFDILRKGRKLCVAAPKTCNIGSVGTGSGYKHLESHLVYVHRSLTREIAVFEKM